MGQPDYQCERKARAQQEAILGIQIKNDIIHGFKPRGLGEDLGDDADKQKVYEKCEPYVIPVHPITSQEVFRARAAGGLG
jgi:hypothetical protein